MPLESELIDSKKGAFSETISDLRFGLQKQAERLNSYFSENDPIKRIGMDYYVDCGRFVKNSNIIHVHHLNLNQNRYTE